MPFKRRRRHNPTSPAKPLTAAQVERILYGQSIPDKYQRERLEQARKEFQVPDLQSELSKIANAWDDQEKEIRQDKPKEKAMTFTPTGNASRDTFHFIQANPCKYTPASACKSLTAMGYKYGSVHSLLTQLKRIEYIKANVDGELFTAIPEYKPFANHYKTAVKKAKTKPAKAVNCQVAYVPSLARAICPSASTNSKLAIAIPSCSSLRSCPARAKAWLRRPTGKRCAHAPPTRGPRARCPRRASARRGSGRRPACTGLRCRAGCSAPRTTACRRHPPTMAGSRPKAAFSARAAA